MYHLTFIQMFHELLDSNNFDAKSWEIRSLGAVTSTNDYADKMLDLYDEVAVLSKIQTEGRGREGRVWYSAEGGMWLSIGLVGEFNFIELSTPIAHTVKEVISNYVECEVKEPNDVMINGKKVAGVLVETKIQKEKIKRLIIGIGINVNNNLTDEIVETATRLDKHSNTVEIHSLASEVALAIVKLLDNLLGIK